ncbi:MAG: serine--tRNA ligase [Candidatus Terrybacteria bacterium RIFCSPLOWO2_01_FULL_44_24]|uniref:Serine--tRNA ligase n=1 Tax=Candidatus Terrybacteria bacterium RIFCSPHIGHO2_01_FULL_43_35 TaxID=1802361 RepID=A0A1G2PHT4_9BACT|nr:MAG: serine--tRNA ligase [Candidatus Terrybacteria bacterium RIFCSPHIGHO2_01_FULL_43_35]OHA49972.1 MAG: serine--tRNA ligase [Candidatus Terrybacteria bacterium RIFCSPHIGHO2_02_FULL_43_14]OHA51797.1 MAG: serine--tRNA ligase [Candidatus Terrybacteria bacterium RIFCSPLOWO2_01_FULL_44_24]
MLDIKLIRENPEIVKDAILKKGVKVDLDKIILLDKQKRELLTEVEQLRARQKKEGTASARQAMQELKSEIKNKEEALSKIEPELEMLLLELPNIPNADVPEGKDETGNVVVREAGSKREFSFKPLSYIELAQKHELIDTERAGKVSGSRFGYLLREAALIEMALVRYAYDILLKEEFIPVIPPVMIKPDVYRGMGRLTRAQEEERYYLPADDLYLTGSSEHTIGPFHADEIFNIKDLPKRYVGFSSCFRREAGSYGKDTKGILRVHQFDKVEMFSFVLPENSSAELENLVSFQEKLYSGLKIPYRVVSICAGDMGFTDAKQYDIEAWLPGQDDGLGQYRETHSASNTTDFQARGENIKYRAINGKTDYVHMLNATTLALGRTIIAILENYQNKDGSVDMPEALVPYLGFDTIK